VTHIANLAPDKKEQVMELLSGAGLPTTDVERDSPARFLVAHKEGGIVGATALEAYGSEALLRSLVVTPAHRQSGLGTQLVEAAENLAAEESVRTIYLLTETAERFFSKRGYIVCKRDAAPEAIREHAQFRTLCPSSAALMSKRLASVVSPYRVLILCTGNSARSVLSEALLNHLGEGRFVAFSAGSRPSGKVNPVALEVLQLHGIPSGQPRSKSWDEFAAQGAKPIDIVITVCDNAAGEVCPIWPGHPLTAHWGVEDPAALEGTHTEKLAAFESALRILEHRIRRLIELPIDALEPQELKVQLRAIGVEQP
jgi:arsenate reductase